MKAEDLTKCFRCGAKYQPSTSWVYGHYEPGTSSAFVVRGRVPSGHCPICLKPPKLVDDRPKPSIACM